MELDELIFLGACSLSNGYARSDEQLAEFVKEAKRIWKETRKQGE